MKLTCKKEFNDFGRRFHINESYNVHDYSVHQIHQNDFFVITDDFDEDSYDKKGHWFTSKKSRASKYAPYIWYYFYTIKEVRNIKLNRINDKET
jgi:hypothetical protein